MIGSIAIIIVAAVLVGLLGFFVLQSSEFERLNWDTRANAGIMLRLGLLFGGFPVLVLALPYAVIKESLEEGFEWDLIWHGFWYWMAVLRVILFGSFPPEDLDDTYGI